MPATGNEQSSSTRYTAVRSRTAGSFIFSGISRAYLYNEVMIKSKPFLVGYKLFFALLGFSAVLTEAVVSIERGIFNPANFFSYFTIEANTLAILSLLVGAIYLAAGKSAKVQTFRAAVAVYMVIVGLGFSFLLAGLDPSVLTAVPWDNTVLHYIMPIAVLVDFLIDRPKQKIPFKKAVLFLLFPIAYLAYSMLRGYFTGWYPYPFLNIGANGWQVFATGVVAIVLIAALVTWVIVRVSGSKHLK